MNTPPFLLFIHIPKAAGTTLRSIVDCQYGADNVLTYYNQLSRQMLDNLDYHLRASDRDYRGLIGHFKYGVHEILSRQARYVSFLRDPVALAVSSYFEKLNMNRPHFTKPDGSLFSLDETLDREGWNYANQQVKYLTGMADNAEVNEEDLATCLNNITTDFAFVGTVEKFNPSILLLSRALGWKPCLYNRLNPGGLRSDILPSTLTRIASLNLLDRKLHDLVEDRLAKQVQAQEPIFNAALAELEAELDRQAVGYDGHYADAEISETKLPTVRDFLIP